jgi:enoyl-CoA hydratase/carnithine racemase
MEIRLARHGRHIAIVTIDNQSRINAMTRTMLADLGRLCRELERDESCRAIVLTGAGTRAFTRRRYRRRSVRGAGDRAHGQPCAAQD